MDLVVCLISEIRFSTNVFKRYGSVLIHCNVIDQSDHKNTSTFLQNAFKMVLNSSDSKRDAHNSSFGNEIYFREVIRFFEHSKLENISPI